MASGSDNEVTVSLQVVTSPGVVLGVGVEVLVGVYLVQLGAFSLHGLPDQPEGQAGRVALPGQHARRLPDAGLRWPAAGARQLALDQLPGGRDFLLGVERVDRRADLLVLDAVAPQLGGQ